LNLIISETSGSRSGLLPVIRAALGQYQLQILDGLLAPDWCLPRQLGLTVRYFDKTQDIVLIEFMRNFL
jgi:hypothetical protein